MKRTRIYTYSDLYNFCNKYKLTHYCNASVGWGMLFFDAKTKITKNHVYNVYHFYGFIYDNKIYPHKKLKIYNNPQHGKYIVCDGKRFYINGLEEKINEIQNCKTNIN